MPSFNCVVFVSGKGELSDIDFADVMRVVQPGLNRQERATMMQKFVGEIDRKSWRQDAIDEKHPLVIRETHFIPRNDEADLDQKELRILGWNLIAWSMRAFWEDNRELPVAPMIGLCDGHVETNLPTCPLCRKHIVCLGGLPRNFGVLAKRLRQIGLAHNPAPATDIAQVKQLKVTSQTTTATYDYSELLQSSEIVFIGAAAGIGASETRVEGEMVRLEINDPPEDEQQILQRIRDILAAEHKTHPGGRYAIANLPKHLPDELRDAPAEMFSLVEDYAIANDMSIRLGRGWFPVDLQRTESDGVTLQYAEVFVFEKPKQNAPIDTQPKRILGLLSGIFDTQNNTVEVS
ncbi:hypothetical protein [Aliiroseovarius sp. 2305UL8-7]|uniref:hypothetical protein n=1 Tax=Aliiroseovarius conchicola TaxID=3121637 RepID=UPI003526CF3E